jgi:predicted transport protein
MDNQTFLSKINYLINYPNILQLLIFIGTSFSSVVALSAVFLADYIRKKNRPNLHIKVDSKNYFEYIKLNEDRAEGWIKIHVYNTGRSAATDVQVRLVKIDCLNIHGKDESDPQSRPFLWFKVGNINSISLNILPREIDQPFDIGYVYHDIYRTIKSDKYASNLILIKPEIEKPWDKIKEDIEKSPETSLRLKIAYKLQIVVVCRNADARKYELYLKINNDFSGDSHMELHTPERLKSQIDIRIKEIA